MLKYVRSGHLVCRCKQRVTQRYHRVKIRIGFTPITSIGVGPSGPIVGAHSFNRSPIGITSGIVTCTSKLRDNGILSIYGRFPKRNSASISSRGTLPILPFAHRHLSDIRLCPFGRTVHTKIDNVVMKRLRMPIVRPVNSLPSSLSHGIICKLLARRLTFGKLVFASTLTVGKITNGGDMYLRTLRTKGSVILTPHELGRRVSTMLRTIRGKRLPRRRVGTGYQGMLACGCVLKLRHGPFIGLSKLKAHVGAPRAHSLVDELGLTTVAILGGGGSMLPLRPSLGRTTVLGMNGPRRVRPFSHGVGGCASFTHFRLHGSRPRTRRRGLHSSLTTCQHIVIAIARRHLTPCRSFFTGFTPRSPIVCMFCAPTGSVLRVRQTMSITRTIMLTRTSHSSIRRHITSLLFNGTATSKELSTDVNKLFPANSNIAVAPRAPFRFMPRRCKVGSRILHHVSAVTLRKVGRKTCPNYRILIVGSNGTLCSQYFKCRASTGDRGIGPASVCSLTSLSGAAKALLTVVGLCSGNHFGLASGISSCLPFLHGAGGRGLAVHRLLLRRSNLPSNLLFCRRTVSKGDCGNSLFGRSGSTLRAMQLNIHA